MENKIANNYIFHNRNSSRDKHFRIKSYFILFPMLKHDLFYLWQKHILHPRFLRSFYKLLPAGNYEICKIAGRTTFGLKYSSEHQAVWARQLINNQYRYYFYSGKKIKPLELLEKDLGLAMCDATGSTRELNSCFKFVSYDNSLLIMDCAPSKAAKNDVKHFVDQDAVINKMDINIANYCGIRIFTKIDQLQQALKD